MQKLIEVQRIKNKGRPEKEEIAQYDDQENIFSVTYKYKNPISKMIYSRDTAYLSFTK